MHGSMPPTQAAPLLPCGQGPSTKVWHSRFFQSTGGQPLWWHLGCLHVELQQSSGMGQPSGIAVLPCTGLVSFNPLTGSMLDFGLVMSSVQDDAYMIHQQHSSVIELFLFSLLVVSLSLYSSVVSCLTF